MKYYQFHNFCSSYISLGDEVVVIIYIVLFSMDLHLTSLPLLRKYYHFPDSRLLALATEQA